MKYFLSILLLMLLTNVSNSQQLQRLCYTTNGSNCVPAVQGESSKPITTASATTVEVIPLISGQNIFVSSYDFMAAGTTNVTLVYGTGTNCGTGTTALTGAYPLIAQAGISKGNGLGVILYIPASNALCVTNSQAIQISGSVSYAQF